MKQLGKPFALFESEMRELAPQATSLAKCHCSIRLCLCLLYSVIFTDRLPYDNITDR
jgi:hypothetical protein